MRRIFSFIILALAVITSSVSCGEKENPDSLILGDWKCTATRVEYNGGSYSAVSDHIVINGIPYPAPVTLSISEGGKALIDGYDQGTYTYSDKAGVFKFPTREYQMSIPYGILFMTVKVRDVESLIVNSKKLTGSDTASITYWFEK